MTPLYVFDLDGTIANIEHRLHFIKREKPDYDAFYEACDGDLPNWWIIKLLWKIHDSPQSSILILSGRRNSVRQKTEHWLTLASVTYDYLEMRPDGNHEPDEVLKLRMLKDFLVVYSDLKVEFIVDDREKVVNMWRREGFNCLQCNSWEEYKKGSK